MTGGRRSGACRAEGAARAALLAPISHATPQQQRRYERWGLALVLLAAFGSGAARAQTTHYVAFGDSITAGTGDDPTRSAPGYPPRLQSLLTARGVAAVVDNRGLPGETTAAALTRIDSAVDGANVVLIMEGTNDLNAKVSVETIANNLALIGDKVEQHGAKAVHATVIPRLPDATTDGSNITTGELAGALREVAWENFRKLVDPFEVFFYLTPGAVPNDYFGGTDKLHPNAAGYDLMAKTFADVLTGIDAVPPVTGAVSPTNASERVPAKTPIAIDLFDFGAGIDIPTTQVAINGQTITPVITGDPAKIQIRYQPPQPLSGLVVVHVHSQDRASPPNVLDRDVTGFLIEGTTFLLGDINRDGRVDGLDLIILAVAFGAHRYSDNYNILADLNGDGVVDGLDLAIVAANFGKRSF